MQLFALEVPGMGLIGSLVNLPELEECPRVPSLNKRSQARPARTSYPPLQARRASDPKIEMAQAVNRSWISVRHRLKHQAREDSQCPPAAQSGEYAAND